MSTLWIDISQSTLGFTEKQEKAQTIKDVKPWVAQFFEGCVVPINPVQTGSSCPVNNPTGVIKLAMYLAVLKQNFARDACLSRLIQASNIFGK